LKKYLRIFFSPSSNINAQCSIPLESWKNHFEKFFQGLVDEDAEEIDGNLTKNENEIFNSEIADKEMLTSIRSLKSAKAPGLDDFPHYLFKCTFDLIMPLMFFFI
jgi:hypothetical protein